MMFADNMCVCKEKNDPHRYCYTGKCFVCEKEVTVEIPGKELYKYRQGDFIQDALKSLSKADREFLKEKIKWYRPEVLVDPNYHADEPIEE